MGVAQKLGNGQRLEEFLRSMIRQSSDCFEQTNSRDITLKTVSVMAQKEVRSITEKNK